MTSTRVIQADLDHTSIISRLHNSSFSYWIKKYGILYGYTTVLPENVKEWLELPNNNIWLAYAKNEPVGYAHCKINECKGNNRFTELNFVETKESFGQSKIGVHPIYSSQGIATSFLKTILDYYTSQNVRNASIFCYNNNLRAISILQKLQFQHKSLFFDTYYSYTKPFQCDSVLATLNLNNPLPNIVLNKNITIRSIKRTDLKGMTEIFRLSRPDVFGEMPTFEDILKWYNSDWAEETLVAEVNDIILGCMEFSHQGIIGIPGVLPQYRRQGIGSTLLYRLLQKMQMSGKEKALVDTGYVFTNAIRLYRFLKFDMTHELWNWVKILNK
jgi:ribosomal protein S18 acetylase RimI-like enzyme